MSRARNIKPGFFKNDRLAECDPLARILFVGLWCEADREGRLEDRPKRLKAEYLCYDNCDVDTLLDQLASGGFILRYAVSGCKYIQILAFKKHQNPHVKEGASTIPAPDEHSASTVPAGLIPDSPSLIPYSREKQSATADLSPPMACNPPADLLGSTVIDIRPKVIECPHAEIVAAYHDLLPELRQMREWSGDRQKFLRSRWREDAERQDLHWWREFFGYIRQSDFLMGRTHSRDGRPFDCDLEWIVRPTNFRKIIEGKYENKAAA